ncbi:chromatin-modulating protein mrc1 [Desmophyllum pertusum]|uniref:Chromatin-modulating protein mrc1 n=1 Tax=Desmophyllum pertusum TaxID=174260 RepID=A0A9X0DAW4_9CNID|nr:chromatin-modulating protein mrc1 [Desmophyllum pertusum]
MFCRRSQGRGSGDPYFKDSCYFISTAEEGQTWAQNRATCKVKGGDLVSIETKEEWKFIRDQIQKKCIGQPNEWHIGLKNGDNGWKWVNGKPLTFCKWQVTAGEPSGDGNVVVMSKDFPTLKKGLFNDLSEALFRAYICEIPKGKAITEHNESLYVLLEMADDRFSSN